MVVEESGGFCGCIGVAASRLGKALSTAQSMNFLQWAVEVLQRGGCQDPLEGISITQAQ